MRNRVAMLVMLVTLGSTSLVAPANAQAGAKQTASNTVIAPIDRERSIFTALEKNDVTAFNNAVGADFMYVSGDGAMKWEVSKSAELLKTCKTGKQTLSNVTSTPQGDDLMILTYTVTGEQTCNGKKSPSPTNAMSVWRKVGGRWIAIAHAETPAVPAAK